MVLIKRRVRWSCFSGRSVVKHLWVSWFTSWGSRLCTGTACPRGWYTSAPTSSRLRSQLSKRSARPILFLAAGRRRPTRWSMGCNCAFCSATKSSPWTIGHLSPSARDSHPDPQLPSSSQKFFSAWWRLVQLYYLWNWHLLWVRYRFDALLSALFLLIIELAAAWM